MRALQYVTVGRGPELVDLPRPVPGPGQVLIEVTAAGACHTDVSIMESPPERLRQTLPLTLGHEAVGVVAEIGAGVHSIDTGDEVAVYGAWGCGRCATCATGAENYCPYAAAADVGRPGLSAPGGMAELMLVDDPRHLVPLGGLDPVAAVGLTDAGLTTYQAVKAELSRLGPGSVALVIGIGGLGHVAVQLLRALTASTVLAVDRSETKLDLARRMGAHHMLPAGGDVVAAVRELTAGVGADVVFDVVASTSTLDVARQAVRLAGSIQVIGGGGGLLPTGAFSTPFGTRVSVPFWGGLPELHEVLELARAGVVSVETEVHVLERAVEAYCRLAEGRVAGRAVVVP